MRRKEALETGQIYHIFNRSIVGYTIFNDDHEYTRMLEAIKHYRFSIPHGKLSACLQSPPKRVGTVSLQKTNNRTLASIVAFCLMPTHFHLVLKQEKEGGISTFIGNIQNSYTRYFNLKHKRRGPLWEGRFKNVLVDTDTQLLHLTRYLHLNPTTANLVKNPENWMFSSYQEYTTEKYTPNESICQFEDVLEISPDTYRTFVEDHTSYQKELRLIKQLTLE